MIVFWFFMLLEALLIPGVMMGFGSYFSKKAPKEINAAFGYRTSMSMKNRDTWEFAHMYAGKVWSRLGKILLPISIVPLLFVFGRDVETVGKVGAIIAVLQLVPMVGSIFPTEIALRKTFDQNGMRKNSEFEGKV